MHMTFALVQTLDDLFACPQLDARGFLHRRAHQGGLVQPLRAFLGSLPPTEPTPAPATPGQDSEQVLSEWLQR